MPQYTDPDTRFWRDRYLPSGGGRRTSAADLLEREIGQETPERGQRYLQQSLEGYAAESMPDFSRALQETREGAVRRGITGGDLGTSYEGDVVSAFDRNLKAETGRRATEMYEGSRSRYLDLLTGQRDYETYLTEQRRRRRGGLFSALGGIAGGIGGFLLGGPAGAYAGAQIGGSAGSAFGG